MVHPQCKGCSAGEHVRNSLPLSSKQLEPKSVLPEGVQEKLFNSTQKQAFYYNLKGTALPELQPGQTVRMKRPQESTWTEAACKKMIDPRSYVVVSGGLAYRRNRRQLSMVPESDFLPVVKQAADSLQSVQSVLQADPSPVVKPASEHVEVASPPTVTRSGRIVTTPVRFQEFAT